MMLMTPEILHASGVLPTGQPVRLRLELVDGTTRAIEPGTLDWNAWMAQLGTYPVGLPSDARLLSLSRRDATFWSQILRAVDDGVRPVQRGSRQQRQHHAAPVRR